MYSSQESLVEVKEILFFACEEHLKETDVPDLIVRRYDKLRNSGSTHDNVAAFLGLIVEEHVPRVAKIFEEYAEGKLMLKSCLLYYLVRLNGVLKCFYYLSPSVETLVECPVHSVCICACLCAYVRAFVCVYVCMCKCLSAVSECSLSANVLFSP